MNDPNDYFFNTNFTDSQLIEEINLLRHDPPVFDFLDNSLPEDASFVLVNTSGLVSTESNRNLTGYGLLTSQPEVIEFTNQKWNATQKRITFSISNREMTSFFDANQSLDDLFQQIFNEHILVISSNYLVQYIINHDTFDRPISSCYMKRNDLQACMIQRSFEDVFQSRKKRPENTFQEAHRLVLTINTLPARVIRGGSNNDSTTKKRKRTKASNVPPKKRTCHEKRDIINTRDFIDTCRYALIVNSDNYCLARAVLVGKAFADKEKNASLLLRKNNRLLNQRLRDLKESVSLPDEFLNLTHLKMIEAFLGIYQITVYDSISNGASIIYSTDNSLLQNKPNKFINIVYECQHFNVITKMTAFLGSNYFCEYCRIKYSNLGRHSCENLCKSCKRYNYICHDENYQKKCPNCSLTLRNSTCEKLHDSGQCFKLLICEKCSCLKAKYKVHVCGDNSKWCPNCRLAVTLDHNCFIQKETKKKYQKKFAGYVWFDIEAFVNTNGFHEANLIMAKRKCVFCLTKDFECDLCLPKYSFTNIQEFVNWCLKNINKNFTFLSHNGKAYDNYFIIRFFQRSKTIRDTNIRALTDGLKVLCFHFRTLTFKDSSLFIMGSLESFSKTFGLSESKGFFPHEFNREENFEYIGPYPEKTSYKPEFFSQEKRDIFEKWYESVKDNVFDFQKEIKGYCWSDVELLSEGCLKFSKCNQDDSKRFFSDPGIDPLENNITCSSYCNTLYRRNFMPSDSIAWIPSNGFNPKENTSKKCIQWLKFVSETQNIYIQHAKNSGEYNICNFKVDGICFQNKTIYEFQGCLWHGCEKCNGQNTFNPVLQTMNYTLRLRTESRLQKIKEFMPEFKIIEIWEHEWDKLIKEDKDLLKFVEKNPLSSSINLRDALYGGRTNALKLYHKCSADERISYIDFCSLYPAVQKYCIYPTGHPTIISENFDYNKVYFGIIKCQILPPKDLYLPVLPLKINNKLIFTLCMACAKDQINNFKCSHDDSLRTLTGTWVSLEIDKALEMGYKLVKYEEIYEFSGKTVYNKETKTGGLFTDYINYNLKAKQESSGYPANCNSEIERDNYIKNYYETEGIMLEKQKLLEI